MQWTTSLGSTDVNILFGYATLCNLEYLLKKKVIKKQRKKEKQLT